MNTLKLLFLTLVIVTNVFSQNALSDFSKDFLRLQRTRTSIAFGYSLAEYRTFFAAANVMTSNFGIGFSFGRYNVECPEFNPFIRGNVPYTLEPVYCPNGVYAGINTSYRFHFNHAVGIGLLTKFHDGITVQFNQEVARFQEIDIDNRIELHPYFNYYLISGGLYGAEIGVLPWEPMLTGLIHFYF